MINKTNYYSYNSFIKKLVLGKVFKNFSWNSSSFILSSLISLISAPLYIKFLGLKDYGVFVLFNSIIGFMKLGEFGLGNTVIKYVSEYNSKKQKINVTNTVNSIFTVYLIVSVILTILFILLRRPILELLIINNRDNADILSNTLLISFFGFFIYLFNSYFLAIHKAFERFRFVSLNTMSVRVVTVITGITLAFIYRSVSVVLISSILIQFFNNTFLFLFTEKKLSLKIRWMGSLKFFKTNLLNYTKWVWAQNILGILYSNIDKFLITILVGLKALAIYHLAVTAAYFLPRFIAKGMEILLPYFSRGQDKYEKLKEVFVKGNLILSAFLSVFMIILFHAAAALLNAWLGSETSNNVVFPFQILLISGAFTLTPVISYHLVNGLGYARENAFFGIFAGTMNIIIISIFGILYGFLGVLYARLANIFTATVVNTLSYNLIFNKKRLLIGIKVILPLLAAAFYIILRSSIKSM